MRSDLTAAASLAAILALAATAAAAAVPEPPINGVVVQDVTLPFVFDRIGFDNNDGPYFDKDAYQGTVRSRVIHAPDNTFDFYFHITASSGSLVSLSYLWQEPASYTVAYHVTNPVLEWAPRGPSGPGPGFSQSGSRSSGALWAEDGRGALREGVFVLDTDARAYAATASYQLADRGDFLSGNWDGESPVFTTFGPSPIPEPETYALMLCGLGLLALARRRYQRSDNPPR